MERVTFFTLATESVRGFPQYLASCARHGIEPRVLGMGQKWEGFAHKNRVVREQLDNLCNDEFVVVSDCYDVVFQKGPKDIVKAFLSYRKPVVISAERGTGFDPLSNTILPETPNPLYRSLNAGFWMARVGDARNVIDEMWDDGEPDDQKMFYRWYAKNHGRAMVDYKNILVTSSSYRYVDEDLGYRDNLVYNKHTCAVPCAIHLSACTDMTKIYEALKFSSQSEVSSEESIYRRYQNQIYELAAKNPWPAVRPDVEPNGTALFGDGNARLLGKLLERPMSVILELGSWVGAGSTRFFLDHSDALLICNDTWRDDSPEMADLNRYLVSIIYETFCRNNWHDRERIIPLRLDTMDGLREVAETGIIPDLIYVDANHAYENVIAQLDLICKLFPSAIVTGDDFEYWPQVGKAVTDFAEKHNIQVVSDSNCWMFLK